jgi:hypothetical protein
MPYTSTLDLKKCKSLKKITLLSTCLVIGLFCTTEPAHAQVPANYEQAVIKDTIPKPRLRGRDKPKRFGRASWQLGTVLVLPWVYDKFVAKKDYANISFETVGTNLKPNSWEWDDDEFQTNQFGHPFHGSQFYNSFRTNGYTFWQSVPATMVGSYLWETTAENMKTFYK